MLKKLFKLLPILSFLLASFSFIFSLPATPPVDNNTPSMSMSGNGFGLHSANYKLDITFNSLAWLAPALCYFVLFFFFRNYFVISHIYTKTTPTSSGIRAPPFQV